jgi:hypothetical protein
MTPRLRAKLPRALPTVTRLEDRTVPAGLPVVGPLPAGALAAFANTGLDAWQIGGRVPDAPAGLERVIRPNWAVTAELDAADLRAVLPDSVHTFRPDARPSGRC